MRIVTGLALTLAATACVAPSARPAGPAAADGSRVVEVQMSNFSFAPSRLVLTAGERVTLRFVNMSPLPHEFMAGRKAHAGGGYEEDLFRGVDVDVRAGEGSRGHGDAFELEVAAHMGTGAISFVVPDRPGTYEIGCFEPGHYEAGMKGELVIR